MGVTLRDLTDAQITDFDLDTELTADLEDWLPTYPSIITDGTGGSPTAEQTKKYNLLKVYAKYFCCLMMSPGLRYSLQQKITDNNIEMQRFIDSEIEEFKKSMAGKTSSYKTKLLSLIDSTSTSGKYDHFGISVPTPDVVTGL